LGYIGIVWPKEHSPKVWSVPPVTPCIYIYIYTCTHVCVLTCSATDYWRNRRSW